MRTFISRTNAYACCCRPILNVIERFDLGRSLPTASPLHLVPVGSNVCTDYVELFIMNMNLKMCCILSLCAFLCEISKASENQQSLILSSVFVVIIVCCLRFQTFQRITFCGVFNFIQFASRVMFYNLFGLFHLLNQQVTYLLAVLNNWRSQKAVSKLCLR